VTLWWEGRITVKPPRLLMLATAYIACLYPQMAQSVGIGTFTTQQGLANVRYLESFH
jgi:hypothetical protein